MKEHFVALKGYVKKKRFAVKSESTRDMKNPVKNAREGLKKCQDFEEEFTNVKIESHKRKLTYIKPL